MEYKLASNTTTRVISQEFDYSVPASLEEALELRDEHGDDVRPLAGGTDLLIQLKADVRTESHLMYVNGLDELDDVSETEEGLEIGATVTYDDLMNSSLVDQHVPILAEAASDAGGVQVEKMGTIGGNLCNGSPAASTAPPLLILGAEVVLESVDGERIVPIEEFFTGPKRTVLEPNELLTSVRVPTPASDRWAHEEIKRVTEDLAKVIVSVSLECDDGTVTDCGIGLGCVAPTPIRATEAEAAIRGEPATEETFARAGEIASDEISPISDSRSTAEYRRLITETKVRDLLVDAHETNV
ncbi:FAD binding domain-containing protein [Natrarchaeobius oligotrophus]|uniref:Xanthine dehydrogenase family protein subunit M n=1 Tax=Natrarchaeobius chitinivorans TaxID=1679083 RepID=A0A3N6PSG5_NATCH|nr:xanthine dehydrogenase family protein subunit M [Natrarchaeobius chitinivorans]RQH02466.1 xanthine dehydrogenase family protein subunit M [Natrarchaeobius chitinivorans]